MLCALGSIGSNVPRGSTAVAPVYMNAVPGGFTSLSQTISGEANALHNGVYTFTAFSCSHVTNTNVWKCFNNNAYNSEVYWSSGYASNSFTPAGSNLAYGTAPYGSAGGGGFFTGGGGGSGGTKYAKTTGGQDGEYVQVTLPFKFAPDSISITNRNGNNDGRCPLDSFLYGSNDGGTTWTLVKTLGAFGTAPGIATPYTASISGSAYYTTFRYVINRISYVGGPCNLNAVQMTGYGLPP